jgi:protein SCO1/2
MRRDPELAENAPRYRGLSPAQAARARGHALAALAETGLPDAALPIVTEVLRTSIQPYEIAGAAIGLRGHPAPPQECTAALRAALDRLRGADPTIDLSSPRATAQPRRPTTATAELTRTLDLLRDRPHPPAGACCAPSPSPVRAVPEDVRLQDQHGHEDALAACLGGRPALVTFSYTRCDNPYRCSATIARLARLQRAVRGSDLDGTVTLAAITYDPDFDRPEQLRRYGRDRGVDFDGDTRFFRAVTGFAELRDALDLGVGYGSATVNNHRIEAYVLDAGGAVAAAFLHEQWSVDDALRALRAALSR